MRSFPLISDARELFSRHLASAIEASTDTLAAIHVRQAGSGGSIAQTNILNITTFAGLGSTTGSYVYRSLGDTITINVGDANPAAFQTGHLGDDACRLRQHR